MLTTYFKETGIHVELLQFIRPTKEQRGAIEAFKQEFFDAGESVINGGSLLDQYDLDTWFDHIAASASAETVAEGWVPESVFLAVREADCRIVGIISIRHNIQNEFLATYAGHVGYAVRPSERKKGYATTMLGLAADHARELGIERLMIGCYSDNIASKKTIEAWGGKLVETKPYTDGKPMDVYWLEVF